MKAIVPLEIIWCESNTFMFHSVLCYEKDCQVWKSETNSFGFHQRFRKLYCFPVINRSKIKH